MRVVWAFWVFNLATSATYILNDVMDAKRDRLHPIKKNRPIAKGELSSIIALGLAILLSITSLIWAEAISHVFFLLILTYFVLQIAYSFGLKNIHIVDILIIATGFIIRVYSGAFIIDAHLSVWFLLCVVSVALFLASGKRRAELGALGSATQTRISLQGYSTELLDSYVTMFGNAAWMSWALYTFFESPRATVPFWLILAEVSRTTTIAKLLMITIPVTIFGIMRYQSLIFEGRTEAPEKLLLKDKALVGSVIIWVTMVIWVLYGGIALI
ncbi:MAG: Phosphoribose diphosphate:decaprenyl-phosphate phosphoribosyltransferase [Candidatus Woesebacteria bacterium GW2011_GWB1_43_14]|uniref:Phosphoribose diphosphate:decaprenyl-phosphate phosphoribosyltransferase n=1 Tax=Candidatus Woesebacteria bacterium GW2011_GWB1_43_14 TaxID=1618578 RepID=A0A0G1DIE7_9BACT|nr:MAG: Phosphoribose diphosphate:decaprenyl-phosphate phosphoribosyltransferase [Candidatus Woesebacteria bacterium GW2011_GWB1_43_14]